MSTDDERRDRVYGVAAALAAFEHRPEDVVRIVHGAAIRPQLGGLLREAARRRIAYREVGDEELSRIAGAVHHEGVCVLMRRRAAPTVLTLLRRTEPSGLMLALDGVGNPHNIGAALRTAAFFGVRGMLIGDAARQGLTGASVRVAEGGAEHVPVVHVADLPAALSELASGGLKIIGADGHAKSKLGELRWPARCALVLGSEQEGLCAAVRKRCDVLVGIPGSGAIESLNISVAAGILMAGYAAQHPSAPLGGRSK
jgi:TrmH RNA methyltransferase